MEKKYTPGQWVWGIEFAEGFPEYAEVCGYLYMAECEEYIICCPQKIDYEDDFKEQLEYMYNEHVENWSCDIAMLKKEYTYGSHEEAKAALKEMQ